MATEKIDIEKLLIWALRTQCADVSRGSGLAQEMQQLTGGRTSATGAAEAVMRLGTRVDGGGHSDRRMPADATTVAAAVDRLPIEAAALVVMAARSMSPIDWGEDGVGQFAPVLDRRGNHKKQWEDPSRCKGLLGWEYEFKGPMPSDLNLSRMQYVVWWEAMKQLARVLDGRLTGWDVSGPKRSADPWNEAPRVIHWTHEAFDGGGGSKLKTA